MLSIKANAEEEAAYHLQRQRSLQVETANRLCLCRPAPDESISSVCDPKLICAALDSHRLTLDLNTVNKHLRLSEKNREITRTDTERQSYPDHPDRFDVPQVLCRESVCERCYWEIECSGEYVHISVSYKSIGRKGRGHECQFGSNDQSWSLICSPDRYSFIHNNKQTVLPVKPISHRIKVFVDHSAGTLSFYTEIMSLIHTVQTTFTQPLYPGFGVYYYRSSVKLCK
ncbi:Stonustoxin subunit alpha [Anabarilius grahami]|uniref:Stonustoxin subunit alpha n=1 Tax=Anabarilius grahami TaxID=495550 RepID=A0A3N0XT64_ANAGA|nr:Stonustoxin subunit alpha [Anabarilius grahami]